MKTFKFIITNLILVAMLVILTGGLVYADDTWDVDITFERETVTNKVTKCYMTVKNNGAVVPVEDLVGCEFFLSNNNKTNQNEDIYFEISSANSSNQDWISTSRYNATYEREGNQIVITPVNRRYFRSSI